MAGSAVGIIHPGAMGVSVAAAARNSGHTVYWASAGRSAATRQRAEGAGLLDAGSLGDLCRLCSVVISVCPPHAAEEVAEQVRAGGFRGLYLDANAISPMRVAAIGAAMTAASIRFVDGGIVGGPAWEPGQTWLYLSGQDAADLASLFAAGPLETTVLDGSIGRASALKMCYAAYTKGTTALLAAILATSEEFGVRQALMVQWERDWPSFPAQAEGRAQRVTAKAWRFAGEMEEIAATFRQAGLPGGFHGAAADLYRRLAHFKDEAALPPVAEVLAALLQRPGAG
jgi:3-hydroxyisobutyrate dehydrogenase-like beta-hydroxyacid dehydrogenase